LEPRESLGGGKEEEEGVQRKKGEGIKGKEGKGGEGGRNRRGREGERDPPGIARGKARSRPGLEMCTRRTGPRPP